MAEELQSELYECNTCSIKIPDYRARVFCNHCLFYHLCANCYVVKDYARPHVDSHPTSVFKQSGFYVPGAPEFSQKPPTEKVVAAAPILRPVEEIEIPLADWSVLWSFVPGKKKTKTPDPSKEPELIDLKDVTGAGIAGNEGTGKDTYDPQVPLHHLPLTPPRSIDHDGSTPSYPMPQNWEPFFGADNTPTPIFIALMGTIFSCLDPEHTGYLSPEVYSDFLDFQGYQWTANVCKFIASP